MPVRKTESRLPASHLAADLGQSISSADGRCTLISFISNPLVVDRENTYVLFVTDTGLATTVQSFEWSFVENGGTPSVHTTPAGEMTYRPLETGTLTVIVRAKSSSNAELASITLAQDIVATNTELETLINDAREQPGAGVGSPDAARELVNDHNPYYQAVELQAPETDDGFKRFVFSMVYEGAIQRTPAQRREHLAQVAAALNEGATDYASLAGQGAGISGIRLALLAMSLSNTPPIPWTELPEATSDRALADEQLRSTLAALEEQTRIDLFNLVRFPKSNITWCGRILEGLRNRYFSGANFNDVLTGMSGTRAHWITRHFKEGPLQHS